MKGGKRRTMPERGEAREKEPVCWKVLLQGRREHLFSSADASRSLKFRSKNKFCCFDPTDEKRKKSFVLLNVGALISMSSINKTFKELHCFNKLWMFGHF